MIFLIFPCKHDKIIIIYYYNNDLVERSKKLFIRVLIALTMELLKVLFASISTAVQNLSKLFIASYKNIKQFHCRIHFFLYFYLLTDHLQETLLTLHRVCIDLTHVPSSIGFSDFSDMKKPYSMITMSNRDPMIFRNHVTMNG